MHKHNCNEIVFDCYNHPVFMKTGYEIKMIEIQSDVIRYFSIIEKHNSTMKKNWYDYFIQEKNGYRVVNQYIKVLTLQK